MNKLLTISVAAYNIETTLDTLMRSIIAADVMPALEVLIVSDGSTDCTAALAQTYAQAYPDSVRLIEKPNGGHGSTINRGIREAKGKYFRALDGDDWLHSEHLAALIRRMETVDADIILSNFRSCYDDGREEVESFPALTDGETYSFDEVARVVDWMRYHTVIYRTSLLQEHDIRLDEHCFYVDTEFMLYPVPFVSTVYYAKDDLYCYRLGDEGQSVSIPSRVKHIENGFTVAESLLSYYEAHKEGLSEEKRAYFVREIASHCIWHIKSLIYCPESSETHERLVRFDRSIRDRAPEIWREMANKGVKSRLLKVLRYSGYRAYGPLVRRKVRRGE